MTLQSVLSFINIVPGAAGDQFVNQVQSLVGSIYGSSPTMRSALDIRVATGIPLSIAFEPGVMQNVSVEFGPVNVDIIQIDPAHADQYLSVNQFGSVLPRGFAYMFLHELCHALFATSDPSLDNLNTPGFDFLGDNVRLENLALIEMGISDLRIGYFATFDDDVDYLASYTGGAKIDYAFKNDLGFGIVDASQSMQKNQDGLLIGSATSEALTGGNGHDYLWGLDGADFLAGGLGNDTLIGGSDSDVLDGLGGDDFIFFDAADGANVYGGAGRDVAAAVGQEGVTVDMIAQDLEVVIGGMGADTIIMGGSPDILFAAGGDGADTFVIGHSETEATRVIWGGGGADTFVFADGVGGGIAVVTVAGLTEEKFASLTIDDLDLGGLNLGAFRAIILNPEASDHVTLNGFTFSNFAMPDSVEWKGFSSTQLSGLVGRPLTVFGGYERNYEFEATLEIERDEFENVVSIKDYLGRWLADGTEEFNLYEYDPNNQSEQDEADAFILAREVEPVLRMTDLATNPTYAPSYGGFYVVGGTFDDSALVASGALAATAPDDPGSTPYDWLMVA